MLTCLLVLLALLKFKFSKNETTIEYLRRRYDSSILANYKQLEATALKLKKSELDISFLYTCRMNYVVPNFVKFRLYKKSLYNSQFYQEATNALLNHEITFKERLSKKLLTKLNQLQQSLKNSLSLLDIIFIQSKLATYINTYSNRISATHNKKLSTFGISQPDFNFMDQVLFNYSSYTLSKKEKFLLSLGLDFCLPTSKPKYVNYFTAFEKLAHSLSYFGNSSTFNLFRKDCSHIAHKTFTSYWKNNWYPFFKKEDVNILKNLGSNNNLVITKPDKGNGVVLLDRDVYISKMNSILSDNSKFSPVDDSNGRYRLIFRTEDKINRFLSSLKSRKVISDAMYDDLYVSSSSFGTLYGSPKVHKGPSVPLRPILAAYNLPNYKLAKFLVPLLSHLTTNCHSIKNSMYFANFITKQNPAYYLVSYDIESLFTNVPILETINIIIQQLFPTDDAIYCGFSKTDFHTLLTLAVSDNTFIFNNQLYKQIEGMAMGSPLGPAFANIFMNALETKFLEECNSSFKPIFYKRYIDDTVAAFQDHNQAHQFLNYINQTHPSIKFTMDSENNNCLNFLDITVTRSDLRFTTNVFRKSCFTGLGLNFYSFSSEIYKHNSCKTLIHRAYSACSDWFSFSSEIKTLEKYFKQNCYPSFVFQNCLRKYLNSHLCPKPPITTVPKCTKYFAFPYLGAKTKTLQLELSKLVSKYYPCIDLRLAFGNSYNIASFFHFKDTLPPLMRSNVVYLFNCPKCDLGRYIGCTKKLLRVRICGHMGVSHRTLKSLSVQENSAVRKHSNSCKSNLSFDHFKILFSANSQQSLLIAESLLIKQLSPNLNTDQSSIPLYVA